MGSQPSFMLQEREVVALPGESLGNEQFGRFFSELGYEDVEIYLFGRKQRKRR